MVTGMRTDLREQRYLVEFPSKKTAAEARDELMMKGYTIYPSARLDRLIMNVKAFKELKKENGEIKVISSNVDMMLR